LAHGESKRERDEVKRTTQLQHLIGREMAAGASLDEVEEEIIEPSDLSDDQKSALWLYAWSYLSAAEQRTQARWLAGALS
jgi:hypothetical protein